MIKINIIGGGINGLLTAYELLSISKKQISIKVFDKYDIPNSFASSHGLSRLIYPFGSNSDQRAEDCIAAYKLWEELWQVLGKSFFRKTGVFVADHEDQTDSLKKYAKKIPIDTASKEIPLLQGANFDYIYHFSDYGVLFAQDILYALKDYLLKNGVRLIPSKEIISIDHLKGSISDDKSSLHFADYNIITTGASTSKLIKANDFSGLQSKDFISKRCYILYSKVMKSGLDDNFPAFGTISHYDLWGSPKVDEIPLKLGLGAITHAATKDQVATDPAIITLRILDAYRKIMPAFKMVEPIKLVYNHYTTCPSAYTQIYSNNKTRLVSACNGLGFKVAPITAKKIVASLNL